MKVRETDLLELKESLKQHLVLASENQKVLFDVQQKVAVLAEHVKTQNGRLSKQEEGLEKVKQSLTPEGIYGKQITWSNTKILLGIGGLSAIGLIALVLTTLATIKALTG